MTMTPKERMQRAFEADEGAHFIAPSFGFAQFERGGPLPC